VRDGGDDEVGARALWHRAGYSPHDTKRTELPRGDFVPLGGFIGRLDRKTAIVVDRGFREGRKANSGFNRAFSKTGREKTPKFIRLVLQSVFLDRDRWFGAHGAAAPDIMTVKKIILNP
jgi:hypothetical protein